MRTVTMIAAIPMRYGTRRLRAGDEFQATRKHAWLLNALKRAKVAPKVPAALEPVAAPVAPVVAPVPADDLEALRARYQELTGRRPHHRAGVDKLKAEIAALAGGV